MYVKAFVPLVGSMLGDMYMLWLAMVKSNRKISHRLLSYSLVVATAALQPTPLCQMA